MKKVIFKKDTIKGYNKNGVYIEKGVLVRKGAVIYSGNIILGDSEIGPSVLYPNNIIEASFIGDNCYIGPFARLRPDTIIEDNCKIGNFVEIKKSRLGKGTKASHLAYIGDAKIGEGCNLGCGVVFCNYDGKQKHTTTIGNNVFIGSNVNFVAPLCIGDNVVIGAGSTITDDISNDTLAIARERQVNKPLAGEDVKK